MFQWAKETSLLWKNMAVLKSICFLASLFWYCFHNPNSGLVLNYYYLFYFENHFMGICAAEQSKTSPAQSQKWAVTCSFELVWLCFPWVSGLYTHIRDLTCWPSPSQRPPKMLQNDASVILSNSPRLENKSGELGSETRRWCALILSYTKTYSFKIHFSLDFLSIPILW